MTDYEKNMRLALAEAEQALGRGEFPVGCVIVEDGKVIANGQRNNSVGESVNETDHAEIIALRKFSESGKHNPKNAVLFCTLEPCLMCYAAIILSGIRTIVYAYEDAMGGGTSVDLKPLPPLYSGSEITVVKDVLRKESLSLFLRFFENPENRYWKGSYLEAYTLLQKSETSGL